MAGVDATMFFVLDVLRNIGGEGTRNLDGKLDHRRHRSSCPIIVRSSTYVVKRPTSAWTTERDGVRELQGSYLFFII